MSTLMLDAAVTTLIGAHSALAAHGRSSATPAQLECSLGLEPLREGGQLGPLIGGVDVAAQRQVDAERDRLQTLVRRQQAQLRQARRQLAGMKAAAQKELSRHLHDNVGASLTGLNLDLTLVLHELAQPAPDIAAVRAMVQDALHLVGQVSENNSCLVATLRPPHLEKEGLAAALLWLVQAFQPRVTFPISLAVAPDFGRLDPAVEYELYHIAQEAIVNAARHAEPQQVTVTLQPTANGVRLVVADDGKGMDLAHFDTQSVTPHWGLANIAERAELIGGRCNIISRPGAGTQIVVELAAEEAW